MSLFDKDFRYTQEATNFENEVYAALRPIFDRYMALGYSPRELEYLITGAGTHLSLAAILDARLPKND